MGCKIENDWINRWYELATAFELINTTIYEELCLGIISKKSREEFLRIIQSLDHQRAEGIILGCTEIGLLVEQSDTSVPLFDTTVIHATKAALFASED